MGKKTGVFSEGQLVYAKVKGYAPWPAKITKVIAKHKYRVYFYGTGETGNCKSEELDVYDERNRGRFNTDRQMKKPEYKEAVDQIELALSGNDPAPTSADLAADDSVQMENNSTVNSTLPQEDISQLVDDFDPEESQLQIAEDIPKSTPAQKKKPVSKPKPMVTPKLEKVLPEIQSETKENDEKISRSGRKIKEKKMNNDEMDPDEVFTHPRKRLKIDDVRAKPVTPNDSIKEFCLSKMHLLQDPERKQFLTTQYEMITAIQDIKQALGLERANINRAITSLNSFKDNIAPNITKIMLLKYSTICLTIKRLRNYIGNTNYWNLEENQLTAFKDRAKQVRDTAAEIYDSFKKLFPEAPESATFWSYFSEEHNKFNEKYGKLDMSDLFEANSIEELEKFISTKNGVEEDGSELPDAQTVEN